MMLPQLWARDALVSARAAEPPCADARDVILPPFVKAPVAHGHGAAGAARSTTAPVGAAHNTAGVDGTSGAAAAAGRRAWRCELFFAGAMRAEQKAAKSSWCDDGARGGVRCYSQGVRAAVYAHHANRSRFCIANRLPSEYATQARFCLAPSGEGFGDRLSASILAGCVPLIIQPSVHQPYDDVLPYERFTLRVGADAIPRLHHILAAVNEPQHAALLRGVRRFASAFEWRAERGGRAYELARYSLCLRAGAPTCQYLRPTALLGERHEPELPIETLEGGVHGAASLSAVAAPGPWRLDHTIGSIDATLCTSPDRRVCVPGPSRRQCCDQVPGAGAEESAEA